MPACKLSGNKGEWSEPYVVLKLASDGVLFQADANMQPSHERFAKVVRIVREDVEVELGNDGSATFHYVDESGQSHNFYVPSGGVDEKAQKLLHGLSDQGNAGAFEIPEIEEELKYLGFRQLKNPVPIGQRFIKRDLSLQIEDPNTGTAPLLGFSVKSELGSAPTLLNASKHTNIVYRIHGIGDADMNAVNAINTRTKIQDRCALIKQKASDIRFDSYQSRMFMKNLQIVDGDLPQMLADATLRHYMENEAKLQDVVTQLAATPRYSDCDPVFCPVKIKRFLRACALGMVPSKPWIDYDEASGGYVIVLPDGELIAFYIYNRAMFDKYLLENTKFEHSDTNRHDYMAVYKDDGKYYIKLNVQIRFTK